MTRDVENVDFRRGAYGKSLGDMWSLDETPTLVNTTLNKGILAVTELRSELPNAGLNDPVPLEDSYIIAVQLRPYKGRLWLDGKEVSEASTVAGGFHIYDLKRDTLADLQSTFHCLQFYLPRVALEAVAEDSGLRGFAHIHEFNDGSRRDEVLHALSLSLLPSLANPELADAMFVDHVSLAITHHVLHGHGDFQGRSVGRLGSRLSPGQERLAKEYLLSRLHGKAELAEVARLCGLSPGYFLRAFKQTTGMPPYAWLQSMRIARARNLLAGTEISTAEVALICGFSSQSHMTRIFTQMTGLSPAAWRKRAR